jgi:hypothetical protein
MSTFTKTILITDTDGRARGLAQPFHHPAVRQTGEVDLGFTASS